MPHIDDLALVSDASMERILSGGSQGAGDLLSEAVLEQVLSEASLVSNAMDAVPSALDELLRAPPLDPGNASFDVSADLMAALQSEGPEKCTHTAHGHGDSTAPKDEANTITSIERVAAWRDRGANNLRVLLS